MTDIPQRMLSWPAKLRDHWRDRFVTFGDSEAESVLPGSPPESASSPGVTPRKLSAQSLRDVIANLKTGFIGVADVPSALCPFHTEGRGCRRQPPEPDQGPILGCLTSELPWWKRHQPDGSTAQHPSCAMLEALRSDGRVFIWDDDAPQSEDDIRELVSTIRLRGPHAVLWVTQSGAERPRSMVEYLGQGLLKGYVTRLPTGGFREGDPDHGEWLSVLVNGYSLFKFLRREGALYGSSANVAHVALQKSGGSLMQADLAEAASQVSVVEESSTAVPVGSVGVGGACSDHDSRWFPENPGVREVRGALVTDVLMSSKYPVLLRNGFAIREIAQAGALPHELDALRVPLSGLRAAGSDRTVVIGFNRGFDTYYHWIWQSLPTLDTAMDHLDPGDCVMALPKLTQWQEETLILLGLADIPRIEVDPDHDMYLRRVYYSEYLTGLTAFSISPRSMATFDKMSSHVAFDTDAPKRLYVSRSDSSNRRIANERDVEASLAELGFSIIVPGALPVREQIRLFKSAEIVVGPHGSGMANVGFCRRGTKVVELIQSNYANACMTRIAQARLVRYHAEFFEVPSKGDVHDQTWIVDLRQLSQRVAAIVG